MDNKNKLNSEQIDNVNGGVLFGDAAPKKIDGTDDYACPSPCGETLQLVKKYNFENRYHCNFCGKTFVKYKNDWSIRL